MAQVHINLKDAKRLLSEYNTQWAARLAENRLASDIYSSVLQTALGKEIPGMQQSRKLMTRSHSRGNPGSKLGGMLVSSQDQVLTSIFRKADRDG